MADLHAQYLRGYSIGVGGVVLQDNRVLLVRRASNPRAGDWALPGGYIEHDETADVAVKREVLEETGVQTEVAGLIGLLHRWIDGENGVYLMFLMHAAEGQPHPDGVEVDDVRFFALEELNDLPELQWLSRFAAISVLEKKTAGLPGCPVPDEITFANSVLYL